MVNKKVYIGQTRNVRKRISDYRHPESKRHNSGINKVLFEEGPSRFKFEIIEKCDDEKLTERENYYIKYYNSANPKYGYNIMRETPHYVESVEIRKKKSLGHLGLKESSDTKRKKSNTIMAVKDNILIISDSGKLFGDYIGKSKDLIKNGLRQPTSILGYNFYYSDREKRDDIRFKMLNKRSIRNEEYMTNLEKIDAYEDGDLTLEECFDDVYFLSYDHLDEDGKPYLIKYIESEDESSEENNSENKEEVNSSK